MHDPDVVAHDIVLPIPRLSWRESVRWQFRRRRRTNDENLGEWVYPWWRPIGYNIIAWGRRVRLVQVATIWHREPGGHDSGEICKHWRMVNGEHVVDQSWRWHVHHWHIQFITYQYVRRWLLTRCEYCGGRSTRRNPVNCSNSWDPPRSRWYQGEKHLHHGRCTTTPNHV